METDNFFRFMFGIVAIVIHLIRFYGHLVAGTFTQERKNYDEGWFTKILRPITVVVLLSTVVYMVDLD